MRLFDDKTRYVDRFGLLLVVTTFAIVTLSLVDLKVGEINLRSEIGQVLVSVFVGASLLLALRASGVARRYRLIADVLIVIGVIATALVVILTALGNDVAGQASLESPSILWVTLSALAPVLVVRRLIHHDRASGQTLLGAVSAYLLIALAFNFSFLTVDAHGSTPFFGTEEPTTSFMYFSLVTIATLGYGDLTAAEPLGRLLSTIEAVIGQIYLVTFVALIVGLIVGQREHRVDAE